MLRFFCSRLSVLTGLVIYLIFSSVPVEADMIYGTFMNDTITVSPSMECEGIQSFWGSDVITIETGASVINDETATGWLITNTSANGIDSGLGDDTITNYGSILLNTESIIPVDPLANSATASAIGITTGGGNDTIYNYSEIDVASKAEINTDGLPDDSNIITKFVTDLLNNILAEDNNSVIDAATANAVGMDAGNGDNKIHTSGLINVEAEAVQSAGSVVNVATALSEGIVTGTGDDEIINNSEINVSSSAEIHANDISANGQFIAIAINSSTATALSTGINGKAGNDKIINGADINVNSNADISTQGASAESQYLSGSLGTATATAISKGIDGGLGNDTIINEAMINVNSVAEVLSQGASADSDFFSLSIEPATATATSTGIDGGLGSDHINNQSMINIYSSAEVSSQSVIAEGDNFAESIGASTAVATATGINGGFGNDEIENNSGINVNSKAGTGSLGASGTYTGPAGSISFSTAIAESTCIKGGPGDDTIVNSYNLEAQADSIAQTVKVSISGMDLSPSIASGWDGATTATATSTGISTGLGNNTIENQGNINLSSAAQTQSGAATGTPLGVAVSVSTSTATADATCINGGLKTSGMVNTGNLSASTSSRAEAVSVSASGVGLALSPVTLWDGATTAKASSTGITTGLGDQSVINNGDITMDSTALTHSGKASANLLGIAASTSSSTATSDSTCINAGLRNSEIINTGNLTAEANSHAEAVDASVTIVGGAISTGSIWDGGTKAEAAATGIKAGIGSHDVTNDGDIRTFSNAATSSVNIAGGIIGIAASNSTSTARADSICIDAELKNGEITNKGDLEAIAKSEAYSVDLAASGIGISVSTGSIWNGGTSAEAAATGIAAGLGGDDVVNEAGIKTDSDAKTLSVDVSADILGVAVSNSTSTAKADSICIDARLKNGEISNSGYLDAKAKSEATSVGVAASGIGISVSTDSIWNGGTSAEATAIGIAAGLGGDDVVNNAGIKTDSDATTLSVDVSADIAGVAVSNSTSTANTDATCIDARLKNGEISNSGYLDAKAKSEANSVSVAASGIGISVSTGSIWNGGTSAEAAATGIAAGLGDNDVVNNAGIKTDADAKTLSVDVSADIVGVAVSNSTSTAKADAICIDARLKNGEISNSGYLDAKAKSEANSVSVAASGIGISVSTGSIWNGGTSAEAAATGIAAGIGGDDVVNNAGIKTDSDATTLSVDVSADIVGVAASISTSTAKADSICIDARLKNGKISNTGYLLAEADATADSVAVSVSGIGASIAADSIWNGGTSAEAVATGIAAGLGDNHVINEEGKIETTSNATTSSVNVSASVVGVAASISTSTAKADSICIDARLKNGEISNSGFLDAEANATADAVDVTLTGIGVSVSADARVMSDATATGITAGFGKDVILNSGTITADTTSTTDSVKVSIAGGGVALSADSVLNGGTSANATSTGIDAGWGDDDVTNSAKIETISNATTGSDKISATILGISSSVSSSNANANSICIDGNAGNDSISNTGIITADADSTTESVTVNFSGIGAVLPADSIWNGGTTAEATATGIGAGCGNDKIVTTGDLIKADADSTANAVNVNIAGLGGIIMADDSILDTGTTSDATCRGISGDNGNDDITNMSAITANSTATTNATGISVTAAGAATSVLTSTAKAESIGIAGGRGFDEIDNKKKITITSTATTNADNITVTGAGAGFADADNKAATIAKGIDGGDYGDSILNEGEVEATATSTVNATGTSITLAGYSEADAETLAEAYVTGIDGGKGIDKIENKNTITITGTTNVYSGSVNVTPAGVLKGEAGTLAKSITKGIDGGDCADIIRNEGDIEITATSTTDAKGTSVMIAGYSEANVETTAETYATGIDGGQGIDEIENQNKITITANANAYAGKVDVNLLGALFGEANTTAITEAKGIDGGDCADIIRNEGDIEITATSTTDAKGTSVMIAGYSEANVETTAETYATGIDGGQGIDEIKNLKKITVKAYADASAGNVTVMLAGATSGKAGATAKIEARGIDGGECADSIHNEGEIDITAISSTDASKTSVMIGGSDTSDVNMLAEVVATGIDGGDGNDKIVNAGTINIKNSENNTDPSKIKVVTVNLAGASVNDTEITANTLAKGINGGSGEDTIRNSGQIVINIDTSLESDGNANVVFGSNQTNATVNAETTAIGIDGGDGADIIENNATLTINSNADITMKNDSFTFGGTASEQGALVALTRSTGITGGDGEDFIKNNGKIDTNSTSLFDISGDADVGFGTAGTGSTIGANANSTGVSGEGGIDHIENSDTIDVDSSTTIELGGKSFTFGGTASQNADLNAKADATGINSGAGSDYIRNEGSENSINVHAESNLDSSGDSDVVFGKADTQAAIKIQANSTGIDGEGGNNHVENLTNVSVTSIADVKLNNKSFSFAGGASGENAVESITFSTGISSGSDKDTIRNSGTITTKAESYSSANGKTKAIIGNVNDCITAHSETSAIGINSGKGDNLIFNQGLLYTEAIADGSSESDSDTGWLSGSKSKSASESTGKAYGIIAGDGNSEIINEDEIQVKVKTKSVVKTDANGGTKGGDGVADADIINEGYGIKTENGNNHVVNYKTIELNFTSNIYSGAKVDADTNGDSISYSYANSDVTGRGIKSGMGDHEIKNHGAITIKMKDDMVIENMDGQEEVIQGTTAYGKSDGGSSFDINIDSFTTVIADTYVELRGIEVGDGNSRILNDGQISININPRTKSFAKADGDGAGGDGTATATAITEAQLTGINTGNGNNRITNSGTISIITKPTATATAEADGDSFIDPGNATANANATVTAQAVGIQTGNGDNQIINNGSINVEVSPTVTVTTSASTNWPGKKSENTNTSIDSLAIGILTGNGNQVITNSGEITTTCTAGALIISDKTSATGIQTGSGNDVITNSGEIKTEIGVFIFTKPGIGISSGDGNDQVILENESTISGSIDLGSGDDSLTFVDSAAVTGNSDNQIDGGFGTDTLTFIGEGYNSSPMSSFEVAVKKDPGTYTVVQHQKQMALQRIEVTNGTLKFKLEGFGTYQMSPSGTFQATLNSSTQHGQLDITGTALLGGNLNVIRDTCVFKDGATFDILTAGNIDGSFANETLPEPTALVSFDLNKNNKRVQVVASVDPFTTMAKNSTDMAIASYMDELVPTAEDKLSRSIGAVQMLQASDFKTAFSSLSPESYNMSTNTTFSSTSQHTHTVQNRLMLARAMERDTAYASLSKSDSMLLAFNGSDMGQFLNSMSERPKFSVWADGFGQKGDQKDSTDFSGYDYTMTGLAVGADYAMTGQLITGLSIGYSGTDIEAKNNLSESTIKNLSFSGYGSYTIQSMYLEAVLSYGKSSYDNNRQIVIGQSLENATGSHDGNVLSAMAGCGYYVHTDDWTLVPFSSLAYISTDEEGFNESGANGYDMQFDSRQTSSMTMDLGLKISREFKAKALSFVPEFSLSWNHDFNIDDHIITAGFIEAQGTSFSIEGPDVPPNGLMMGAGIHLLKGSKWTTSIFYNGEYREDYTAHGLLGKVQLMFE